MNKIKGYIKLFRAIWDNPVITKDADHLAVWIYLLTHATHTKRSVIFGNERITLEPGQLVTGRKIISQKTGISESKIRRIINTFKIDQQIDQQTNSRGSLISILNWDKYQGVDQQNDQQVTNNRPTSDQQVTTNNNVKELKRMINHYEERLYPVDRDRLTKMRERIQGVNAEWRNNELSNTDRTDN